jgi:predicted acylesterase/phospholipase RssA
MPMLECDLVMKGGITSGVVYPKAIARLAKSYRLRCTGGTSAGAIAAAAAAAAEFRRQSSPNGDDMSGFNVLADLPIRLGRRGKKHSTLLELFKPQPQLKALFSFVLSFVGKDRNKKGEAYDPRSIFSRVLAFVVIGRVLARAIGHFPWYAVVGALVGALFDWLLGVPLTPSWRWILAGALILTSATGFALWGAWRAVCKLPANGFGMCKGYSAHDAGELTPWLLALLQEISGRRPSDQLLTFGDLMTKNIEFRAVTTNLSHGTPQQLPFTRGNPWAFYREDEWAEIFPDTVMAHLRRCPPPSYDSETLKRLLFKYGLRPLPRADALPIVVAVRLSLSFPFLLSAVPLWLQDPFSEIDEQQHKQCWFSDGGISSNFPLHFFDSPIPERPTFAINLQEVERGFSGDRAWLGRTNLDGLERHWHTFDTTSPQAALSDFLLSIFDVMQNWRDNSLLRSPGYRDRVAAVRLEPHEGGLNLNMPAPLIEHLSRYGESAAEHLDLHFNPARAEECEAAGVKTTWDNHRWVRLLSTLAGFEVLVQEFEKAWQRDDVGTGYEHLLDPARTPQPPSYENFASAQRRLALGVVQAVRKAIADARADNPDSKPLSDNVPSPPMRFRLTPEPRPLPKTDI